MKKFAVIILTLFYLASATGASVNIHYCMGEYAGWDFGHEGDRKCGSCGMDKKKAGENCCKDEHKVFKVDDVHKSAQAFAGFIQTDALPVQHFAHDRAVHVRSVTESYPLINAPPGHLPVSTYLFVRSIRI